MAFNLLTELPVGVEELTLPTPPPGMVSSEVRTCNVEGLFRGPPAAHGYDTPEVRKKEDPKVGIMAKEGGKGRTIAGPPAG